MTICSYICRLVSDQLTLDNLAYAFKLPHANYVKVKLFRKWVVLLEEFTLSTFDLTPLYALFISLCARFFADLNKDLCYQQVVLVLLTLVKYGYQQPI